MAMLFVNFSNMVHRAGTISLHLQVDTYIDHISFITSKENGPMNVGYFVAQFCINFRPVFPMQFEWRSVIQFRPTAFNSSWRFLGTTSVNGIRPITGTM
jgi:hypothetical protein